MSQKRVIDQLTVYLEGKGKITDELRSLFAEFVEIKGTVNGKEKPSRKKKTSSPYNSFMAVKVKELKESGHKPREAMNLARQHWHRQKDMDELMSMFSGLST